MRQIDQIHNAEDEGEPSRNQKQKDAELHAVQRLLNEQQHHSHIPSLPRPQGSICLQPAAAGTPR